MPPRDLSACRALIACANAVEIIDLSEYLEMRGWASPSVSDSAALALKTLLAESHRYSLAVIATRHSDTGAADLLSWCISAAFPVILINGTTRTVSRPNIAMVSRPYLDRDLDRAMDALTLGHP